jgi:hypothetical protein
MAGRLLFLLTLLVDHSRVRLAIRVCRRCKPVDVIQTIGELHKLYPLTIHLWMAEPTSSRPGLVM